MKRFHPYDLIGKERMTGVIYNMPVDSSYEEFQQALASAYSDEFWKLSFFERSLIRLRLHLGL